MKKETQIFDYKIASNLNRLFAFAIDFTIVTMILMSYSYFVNKVPLEKLLEGSDEMSSILLASLLSFFVGAITYPIFSGSIGQRIFGLKVINIKTGEEFKNFYIGGLRELSKSFLANLIIPVLWLFVDKRKQNSYDKLFTTCVVQRQKIAKEVDIETNLGLESA